eukprot:g3636.t1
MTDSKEPKSNSNNEETDRLESLLAGLIFAVHPIHTEAVTGVVGQAELLSAFFSLLAVLIRLHSSKNNARMLLVMMILVFLSTACKEIGITSVGTLCLLELFLPRKKTIGSIFRILSFVFVFIVYFKFRIWIANDHLVRIYGKVENPVAFADTVFTKIMTMLYYHAKYTSLLLFPVQLSADWSYACIPYIQSIVDSRNLLTLGLWLYLIWTGLTDKPWNMFRGEKYLSESRWRLICLTSLMICPFLPSSNLFFYVGTAIGERLLYFPSIGFCLLIARALTNTKASIRSMNLHSTSNAMLIRYSQVCPQSAKVQLNNGILKRRVENYDQALVHFQTAREIEDSYCVTHYWSGLTYIDQRNFKDGLYHLKEALECDETTMKALKALRQIYEVFLHDAAAPEDAVLLEWGDLLLHPSLSLIIDGCMTIEQAAIRARTLKHYTLLSRIHQKITKCIQQAKAHENEMETEFFEVYLKCMIARMDVILSVETSTMELMRFGLYHYLHDVGDQCRRNSAIVSSLPNAHASFINSFQLEDPNDPWLQLEWGKILELQERHLEASNHFNAAGLLFMNCLGVSAKQNSGKFALIYNIHRASNEWRIHTEINPNGQSKTKKKIFDFLTVTECKSLVIESFKLAIQANPKLVPQLTQWMNSIENLKLKDEHRIDD